MIQRIRCDHRDDMEVDVMSLKKFDPLQGPGVCSASGAVLAMKVVEGGGAVYADTNIDGLPPDELAPSELQPTARVMRSIGTTVAIIAASRPCITSSSSLTPAAVYKTGKNLPLVAQSGRHASVAIVGS